MKCGEELRVTEVGAETVTERCFPYSTYYHPYTAYDRETGRRNYAEMLSCPKARWYNSHTRHFGGLIKNMSTVDERKDQEDNIISNLTT